jgi:hypothetical protein
MKSRRVVLATTTVLGLLSLQLVVPTLAVAAPSPTPPAATATSETPLRADDTPPAAAKKNPALKGKRRTEAPLRRAGSSTRDLRTLRSTVVQKAERAEVGSPLNPNWATVSTDTADPDVQVPALAAPAPAPSSSFAGLDDFNWGAGHPPDTNGDVGPTYFIQSINSSIGIYTKSTGVRVAAMTLDTFMSQGTFGNLCDTENFGDPVVLYDTFEDRWVISDFAFQLSAGAVVNPPGNFECIAVSKTSDPVSGGWNFYSTNTAGGLGDYPKLGIWPDGIYMSVNMFGYSSSSPFLTARAYAFNKDQMYAGAPTAQVQSFDVPGDFALLPSNARLQTGTPPAGRPNYFVSSWNFTNALSVYKFHVDWARPPLSTFGAAEVPLASSSWPNANVANAPSQGGNSLDTLQIRAMAQNQYSNIGGTESLWDSHTVRRATLGFAAPRYYQVNVTGGTVAANLPQSATWDPDGADVMHRFMPSVAVNRLGDLAMGYSTSSATTKPAIKYAGRLATDPINTFSQTEQTLIQGTGTQLGSCGGTCTRWGDYSAMTLDPDGCTFWYTNEYYAVDGLDHQTRIGSFAYPGCTALTSTGTLSGTVTAAGAGVAGALVKLGSRTTTSDASGAYSFTQLPVGTYPWVSASKDSFQTTTVSTLAVPAGGTLTQDLALLPAPTSGNFVDTTQSDFFSGTTVNTDTLSSPGEVLLTGGSLVDQANTVSTGQGLSITTTNWGGTTFTAGRTGLLTKADIALFCLACTTTAPVTVSVRDTSGGLPTGADLATATGAGTNSGSGAVIPVTFGTPLQVTAGHKYALVVRPNTAPTGTLYVELEASGSNPYAGGSWVRGATSGTSWAATTAYDAVFHTFVDSGYQPSGTFVSSTKDANPAIVGNQHWGTIGWTSNVPAGTSLLMDVAASTSPDGPFAFVSGFTSGDSLSQFDGKRYLRYRSTLATTDTATTPRLDDVTIDFTNVGAQTITFTGAPATAAYGTSFPVTATASSGLPVTVTSSGACTNIGTSVTMVSPTGTCSLTATQAGNASYLPAPDATQSTAATKAPQTISLTVPPTKVFGDVPFPVSGSATSGLPVTLSVTGPCSISAGEVTISGAGDCTVTGNQAGDTNYFAAPSNSSIVSIGKAAQSITFAALSDVPFGTAPFALSATSTSGLTVSFGAVGSCSVSGTTLTLTSAGLCTVTASQPGNADVNAATDVPRAFNVTNGTATLSLSGLTHTWDGTAKSATVTTNPVGLSGVVVTYGGSTTQPSDAGSYEVAATLANPDYSATPVFGTLTIGQATQTITFPAIAGKTFGIAPFGLNATSDSALPVTYDVGPTDSCTVSGATLTLTHAGSCTVTASQSGDTNRSAAAPVARTFSISKGTITLGLANLNQAFDGLPKPVTVTQSPVTVSGVAVTYDSSPTPPSGVGSYAVHATLTNSDWDAIPVDGTLNIGTATQTITFATLGFRVVGEIFNVNATATSGLPVTFAVGLTDGCTLSGTTVTTVAVGSCTVTASQLGDGSTAAAPNVARSFTIGKGTATLALANTTQTYNGSPRPVNVTTTPSGLTGTAVTYNGSPTAPTAAGTYAVHATMTNPNWDGVPVDGTLLVNPGPQSITFAPLANKFVDDVNFGISATATSGLPVTFSVGSSDPCTLIAATTVHLTGGVGSCTVTANQSGDANREAAAPVANAFSISNRSAVLSATNLTRVYDGTPKSATITTTPAGLTTVTTTYGGSSTLPTDADTYVLEATLDNPTYSAPEIHDSFVIQRGSQTITFAQPANPHYGDPDIALVATSTSGLTVGFSTTGNCTVSGTTLHLTGPGSCAITASQLGNENWAPATSVLRTITVLSDTTGTTVTAGPSPVQYSDLVTLTATVTPGGPGVVHFKIGGVDVGSASPTDGVATLSDVIVTTALGTQPVTAQFVSSDSGVAGSTGSTTIQVLAEDIFAQVTSSPYVPTASPTTTSVLTTLSVLVSNQYGITGTAYNDRHPGDPRYAKVTLINRATNAAFPGCSNLTVVRRSFAPAGDATCRTTLTANSTNGASQYAIGILVNGRFARSTTVDDSLVDVVEPIATNAVTGGGFLTLTSSTGDLTGQPGSPTWAAFGVKYNAARTVRNGTGVVLFKSGGQVYRINAPSFSKVTGSAQQMTLTAPATVSRVTTPTSPVVVLSGLTLVLTTLRDSHGVSWLGIDLRTATGHLVYSSHAGGVGTVLQKLDRGQVKGG